MEIEIFEIGTGYGFQIVENGMVVVYQPTDTTAGNEPMTKERAEEFSKEVFARLNPVNQ
jgi:hypothetical protein